MSDLSIKGVIAGDDFITETVLTAIERNDNLSEYWIAAQNPQRCEALKRKYNINATTDLDFVSKSKVLILTFKAENAKDMLSNLVGKVTEDTIIVSVVPGIALIFIHNFFPKNQIVRMTMNPSVISGEGLAAYVTNKNSTEETKELAKSMLSGFGQIVKVNDENEFEKVRRFILANTFLSYVVVKSMIEAAQKIGFSTEQAGILIDQILKGASRSLLELQFEGGEMLKDGLRNQKFINQAVDLIRDYGIYSSIERYLTTKEYRSLFEAHSDDNEDGLHISYDWFNKMTGD